MPVPSLSATGVRPDAQNPKPHRVAQIDRLAWRRFFLALAGLALSFFLALYATALRESGAYDTAALVAALSLFLAGIVAIKVVPYLARRTALQRWMIRMEYELTHEGLVYLGIIAIVAVAALNTGNNLLFMMLACLLAGILMSGALSNVVLAGVELEFALPEHVYAERPVLARLRLHNRKRMLPSFSIVLSAVVPKGKRREVQYPGSRRILHAPVYVPYIPCGTSETQHVELTFPRRGLYSEDGFRISTKFPFGFLRKARRAGARQDVLVLPNVQPTEEFYEVLPLITGEMESFYKGRGHDLYAIRDYQESDTARHVDWKATAKARQLKVREFTREDERRVVLAFDTHLVQSDPKSLARFEKAVTFCACLAWHFHEIDAQMQFVSEVLETPMTVAGAIIYQVLEALALIEPQVGASAAALPLLSRMAGDPRGFNIILTSQPRGSIPTSLWASSYVIFTDSL